MEASATLADIEELAEQFSSEHLEAYTRALSDADRAPSRKEINDAVWGTVGLTPIEVALLDSPLIQRLRYIRQLGVAHWVYPGALHTRFEHSIGVVFQIKQLVSALNAHATEPGGLLIDVNHEQTLRLAALLHDAGHAAFSHVSEMAIQSMPEGSLVGARFARQHPGDPRNLAEIFAYFVIRSRAMKAFFQVALRLCSGCITFDASPSHNLNVLIGKLSDAVIGKKIDDRLPLLHELLSGPFDADKLDYFARDARLAGTPSVLDISRLVQKITVRAFDLMDLPQDIAKNVAQRDGKYYLFGIKWSGVAVLDELHLARVLMFSKIYRHPKVIAIEQMLRAVILMLVRAAPLKDVIAFLYRYSDDAIIMMSANVLCESLRLDKNTLDPSKQTFLDLAADTLQSIRERRLWVRAFQIQRRYLADPLEKDTDQKTGLTSFREELEHPQKRGEFIKDLLPEIQEIFSVIGEGQIYDSARLDLSIMVHTLGQVPGSSQTGRAFLVPSVGQPMPFREYTVNRAAWADAYLSDQPAGYIFAPHDIADAVYLAVEKLIRIKHGIRLPASSFEASKRDPAFIERAKRKLSASGYYRGSPIDLKPKPIRLTRGDVPKKIQKFADIRAAYQEPKEDQQPSLLALSNTERICLWLQQFDTDDHIDCALTLIDHFRMLTRTDTVNALKSFFETHDEFRGGIAVPLGDVKDSGGIQAYFSADLLGAYISECLTLEQAARSGKDRRIVFVDDFVGSGGQIASMFATAFGTPALGQDLGEQRNIFGEDVRNYLRANKIAFVFTAGWDDGVKAVNQLMSELKLDAVIYRHIPESEIPFMDECLSEHDEDIRTSFLARCSEIGRALINDAVAQEVRLGKKKPSKEKLRQRELGYGNRGMLLATPFNVPTHTLTAIWASGLVDDVPWAPLMARRKKR